MLWSHGFRIWNQNRMYGLANIVTESKMVKPAGWIWKVRKKKSRFAWSSEINYRLLWHAGMIDIINS